MSPWFTVMNEPMLRRAIVNTLVKVISNNSKRLDPMESYYLDHMNRLGVEDISILQTME